MYQFAGYCYSICHSSANANYHSIAFFLYMSRKQYHLNSVWWHHVCVEPGRFNSNEHTSQRDKFNWLYGYGNCERMFRFIFSNGYRKSYSYNYR